MTTRSRLGASARGTPRVPPVDGAQGAQGSTGTQGAQGFQGSSGAQGSQGARGAQGFQGTSGTPAVADLAALALLAAPNGASVFVIDQGESYRLDTTNSFTVSSPLVVAASGGGRWFQRSKAYVVGNFTLWCESYDFGLAGFTIGQQQASSSAEPEILLDLRPLKPVGNQQGVTVDALGNPWVTFNNFNAGFSCQKISLKDCLASGAPSPSVVITGPVTLTEAGHCAFDRSGSLWIANGTHGTFGASAFARYGARAYSKTGTPTPSASIAVSSSVVTSNQNGAVFDAMGNLWVSFAVSLSGNGGICMLSAAQIAQRDSAIVPSVYWVGSNFTASGLGGTNSLAFSPSGLLWSAQYGNGAGTVVRGWDPSQPSGNPAPVVTLTCATFSGPYGIAFDRFGNLWVSNGNNSTVMRIPAASTAVSGLVVPDVVLTPAITTLTSFMAFPNNPDNSGTLPSGLV